MSNPHGASVETGIDGAARTRRDMARGGVTLLGESRPVVSERHLITVDVMEGGHHANLKLLHKKVSRSPSMSLP